VIRIEVALGSSCQVVSRVCRLDTEADVDEGSVPHRLLDVPIGQNALVHESAINNSKSKLTFSNGSRYSRPPKSSQPSNWSPMYVLLSRLDRKMPLGMILRCLSESESVERRSELWRSIVLSPACGRGSACHSSRKTRS
jgi:hypothetical protein